MIQPLLPECLVSAASAELVRVKSAVFTFNQPLPAYPDQRTLLDRSGWYQKQEAPDNAGAKLPQNNQRFTTTGLVEAIGVLDGVPLLHRKRTFVIRHHVCGADRRQRWVACSGVTACDHTNSAATAIPIAPVEKMSLRIVASFVRQLTQR